jgi:hypothetical protein
VDARVLEKLDYPEWVINVDQAKAAAHGLSQDDIMRNVIAATNSSITFNKHTFWIDTRRTGNQYYVGVQYPEQLFHSKADLLNIPITSPKQGIPIPLANVATITDNQIPTESHHVNLQPAIDLTMNVEGRDLGHVSVDVANVLETFGTQRLDKRGVWDGTWSPYDPASDSHHTLAGGSSRRGLSPRRTNRSCGPVTHRRSDLFPDPGWGTGLSGFPRATIPMRSLAESRPAGWLV